jgi:hypothetical protein
MADFTQRESDCQWRRRFLFVRLRMGLSAIGSEQHRCSGFPSGEPSEFYLSRNQTRKIFSELACILLQPDAEPHGEKLHLEMKLRVL